MNLFSNKYSSVFILILSGFILSSCSDGHHHNSSVTQVTPGARADQSNEGIYQANLTALNKAVAGNTSGKVLIKVDGDFAVSMSVINSPASVSHRQYITTGSRCSTLADDTNRDSYLDSREVALSSGKNLIPLDDNLNAQAAGGKYPIASQSGAYFYNESALLDTMLADLYLTDTNTTDNLVKLPQDENLNLAGKVLIVQSVSSTLVLPATVASIGGTAVRTLPIACGVLSKVDDSTPFPLPQPPAPWPWQTSFGTRLSTELFIGGVRCTGNETIPCPAGKWLVTVDNINRCSPEGLCTEIAVIPIVTDLRRDPGPSAATLAFYNLIPRSHTTPEQAQIMKKHWVRFDTNGGPVVLEK